MKQMVLALLRVAVALCLGLSAVRTVQSADNPLLPCTVETTTTNCVSSGSITISNIFLLPSVTTCLGEEIYASIELNTVPSYIAEITTWTPASTNCPPVTNMLALDPIITSNYWYATVTGPGGSYSRTDLRDVALFTPTTCGAGTLTFALAYTNVPPCPAGTSLIAKGTTFTVVNVEIAEPWKAVCTNGTTSFSLTNTCGGVTWEVLTNGTGGEPTVSGSTITAGTNCGNWTVIARSTQNTNCTASSTLYVVKVDSECVSPTPTNRARITIGVGEEVNLTTCGAPPVITWTTSAGSIYPTNSDAPFFTAPSNAATATVTAHFDGGTCTKVFTVLEPTGIDHAILISSNHFPAGQTGAAMNLRPFLGPTTVSFYQVSIVEVGENATSVSGWFVSVPTNELSHIGHGANTPISINYDNSWNHGWDWAIEPGPGTPVTNGGGYTWNIPGKWWIGSGATNNLSGWSQIISMDSSGTITINKFGRSVQRTTSDIITTH